MKDIKKQRRKFEQAIKVGDAELLKTVLSKVDRMGSLWLYSFEDMKQWSYAQDTFVTRKHYISTKDLENSLIESIELRSTEIVKALLIEYKTDGGTHVICANKALKVSLEYNQPEIIELLLQHGANPNEYANGVKVSPLSFAIEFYDTKSIDIKNIELLLQYGADPSFGHVMVSPLVQSKGRTVTELLAKYGADLNSISQYGKSSLLGESLCSNHETEKIAFLLQRGADVNYIDGYNHNIMHNAVISSDLVKLQLVVEYGAMEGFIEKTQTPRELFMQRYPERSVEEYDQAIVAAQTTINYNKQIQSYTIYYLYELSDFPGLPLEVTQLIAEFIGVYGQRKSTKELEFLKASLDKRSEDKPGDELPPAKKQRVSYEEGIQQKSNDTPSDNAKDTSNGQKKDSYSVTSSATGHNQANGLSFETKNDQIILPFMPNKSLSKNQDVIESVLSFLGVDQNMLDELPSLMKNSILKLIESLATIIKLSSVGSSNINLNIFDQVNPLEEEFKSLQRDEESMLNCSRIAKVDNSFYGHEFDNYAELELIGIS